MSFKEGHVGWAGPFWVFLRSLSGHVTLTLWLVLHDVLTLVDKAFLCVLGGIIQPVGKVGHGITGNLFGHRSKARAANQ